jgi:hypothetical protein
MRMGGNTEAQHSSGVQHEVMFLSVAAAAVGVMIIVVMAALPLLDEWRCGR